MVAALAAGCTRGDLVAIVQSPDAGNVGSSADAGAPDAGGSPDDWEAYCAGRGPPILVGDADIDSQVCSGRLAERTFRQALCTCEGLALGASLETDAFHGTTGTYQPGGVGGDVGVNGALSANDAVSVGGSLSVGGAGGAQLGQTFRVGEALHCGGPLTGSPVTATVVGDARVRGDVSLSAFSVGGVLTVPEGHALGPVQAAEVRREPVEPLTPCACDAASQVDVSGLIARHVLDNDNAAIGLAATALEDIEGERALELPCGRFHLTRITGTGHATISIRARTALFVQDIVDLGDGLTVEVQAPGELDLFLGGSVAVAGPLMLGSTAAPSRVRVYVAGTNVLALSAGSTLAGNLYAPRAALSLSGGAEVFGSVFVRHVEASGPLRLHYDADIRDAGAECTDG
ncbi:putative lipoprotein [Corallococcus macrosporus]|uniref:Putative lipoprotein n=2 Tax=Myxococcaceae TaxID=31 RepID=F8CK04_MYXFH|nr:putative lipoprotein [Corallococcus macrosporus]